MPIRVYYEVLNQKGTPALYSDNYAQRPAAGYVGRIFYSPDTAQIFYDTGSTWTLLADAGVGSGSLASVCANGNTTATGIIITAGGLSTNSLTSTNLTAGSIPFIGTGGLFSQDNTNLFWDNTNKYFGINTNTPSTYLDVHGTNNVAVQINNTTTADSKIAFLQAGAGKWRIGNLYSGGTNLFHIYNNAGSTLAMQINSSNAALFYGSLSSNSFISAASGITLTNGGTTTTAGATNIGGLTAGLNIALASGFNQTLTFPTGVSYTYTFPSATGTLALTSNLSSYLPLAGGTLTGQLVVSNASTPQLQVTHSGTGTATIYVSGTSGYSTILWTGGSGGGYGQMSYNLAGNYMQFGTNSSEWMRLLSNGNFGIGTTSPVSILDARGVLSVGSSAGNYSVIQRSISPSGSQGIILTAGAGKSESPSGITFADNSSSGGTIILSGNSSDIYGGGVSITAYGQTASANVITFNTRSGVGTTAERWKIDSNGYLISSSASYLQLTGNSPMYFSVGSILSGGLGGGDLLINNSSSTGGIVIANRTSITGVSLGSGATSWSAYSDERLKTDIEDIDNAIDKLTTLRTIKYHLKDVDQINDKKRLGVIAQDLIGKFDEVIDTDRSDFYQVRYTELIPVLIKAVQELNQKIENLN